MTAEKIGQFEVVRELAKYGNGSLYKASDPASGQTVALRTLQPGGGMDAAIVQRCLQRAREASVLSSPNIAAVQAAAEEHGLAYITIEYVEGISLREKLAQKQEFSVWDLIDISRQVCLALDHARTRGFVHPNLHPGNIVETWDGTIKILGYGLPARRSVESTRYCSPEQLKGEALDLRSSLFNWGAMLYEMVTQRPAFAETTAEAIARKIVSEEPPPMESSCDAGLARVIMKALAKRREERYQTGAELVNDLESCKNSKPVAPPAVLPPPAEPARAQDAVPQAATAPRPAPPPAVLPPSMVSVQSAVAAPRGATTKPAATPAQATAPAPHRAIHKPTRPSAGVVAQPKRVLLVAGAALLLVTFVVASFWRKENTEQLLVTPEPAAAQDAAAVRAAEDPPVAVEPAAPSRQRTPQRKVVAAAPAPAPAPVGELVVDSSPRGAAFQIDGRSDGKWVTPYTISGLSAGQHSVSFSKAGHTGVSRTIDVAAGGKSVLAVELAQLGATVSFISQPAGASVIVDGKDSGRVTPAQMVLSQGKHTLTLRKAGFLEGSKAVELSAGESYRYAPALIALGDAQEVKSVGRFGKIFGRGKEMGRVQIKVRPKGAFIEVNQRVMDKTAPAEFLFPPGHYEVKVTLSGYKPLRRVINVAEGSTIVIEETLQP
jgi:serine/threonine-protein kinase